MLREQHAHGGFAPSRSTEYGDGEPPRNEGESIFAAMMLAAVRTSALRALSLRATVGEL
jgi:hypothetical protein